MSKILAVFGASGNQGRSVIQAVLAQEDVAKEFKIRGISRDASKPAMVELSKQGVEVVSVGLHIY